MNIRETEWEIVDRIHLDQGRDPLRALVNMIMNLWDI